MEFWGNNVRPGTTLRCEAGDGFNIHLTQVALGGTKKGSENVVVFVKVGDKKLAIGTLSADKHPQILCDLVFSEDFELSHNSKTTSVAFCGYKFVTPDMSESDSGEEQDEALEIDEIPVEKIETKKPAAKGAKDGKKDKQDDDNESGDSESSSETETSSGTDDSTSEDDSSDEDDMFRGTDDSMSEDDSSDDSEDEGTPVKPEVGKKRAVPTALKTPASDKKAKIATPTPKKETGDKKYVHVATPYPAKKASKTPADGKRKEKAPQAPADSKAKEKSPKSGSRSRKSSG